MILDDRILTFEEETHTYYLDGVKKDSVTQILAEQNITPNFSAMDIDQEHLSYLSERGNIIHKEIQNFIESGVQGFSDEFDYFLSEVFPLREKWFTEERVYCDDYAGTCDLIGMSEGKPTMIIDIKTGSSWTKTAVAWQTTLYARVMPAQLTDGAEYYCLDLKNSELVPVWRVDEKEVKKLLRCHKDFERTGKTYQPPQLIVPEDKVGKMLALESAVAQLETTVKMLTEQRDAVRSDILALFRAQGVTEYDGRNLKITYISPSKRSGGIDSKKLETDFPEAFKLCKKPDTDVSDSIRVKVKEVC